jgi:hypothetical protein
MKKDPALVSMVRKLMLNAFQKSNSETERLILAEFFGAFVSKNFTGKFREPVLDSFFCDFSMKHYGDFANTEPCLTNESIVHVVTRTYTTGGHSRFIENLIKADTRRKHHLLITDQNAVEPRKELDQLVADQHGTVLYLANDSAVERGRQMLEFLSKHKSIIMLHQHPDDILPSITLPVLRNIRRIIFFNHADHCFSYGVETANEVINIREEASRITVHERKVKRSYVLPLPILKPLAKADSVPVIREKWGLLPGEKLGLCIGSSYKYRPVENHHFFNTMVKALEANPELVIFIVGTDETQVEKLELGYVPHQRLKLLGLIEDPTELQQIADIAIDPMPYGSYTALLETCFYGAYPLVCYDTHPLFDLYRDPSFEDLFFLAKDETEYLSQLKTFVRESDVRHRQVIKDRIRNFHSSEACRTNFNTILNGNVNFKTPDTPVELQSLSFMDQPFSELQHSVLSWLYAHCRELRPSLVRYLIVHLWKNGFPRKELMGILKKRFLIK